MDNDRFSPPPPPCLHCEIVKVAARIMEEQHMSLNEAAYKQVEALAELLAAIGDRNGRRQAIREADRLLRRLIPIKVAERLKAGIPFFEEVRPQ